MANLADAVTTDRLLRRGGREANPIMAPVSGNRAAMYATKAGVGLLTGLLADKIARSGHPTWGKVVAGITIGLPLGAAAHNELQTQRLRGQL